MDENGRFDMEICIALETIAQELREIKELFAKQEAWKEKFTHKHMVRAQKPKKIFEI